jgi:uncharacterized protein (TIGR02996 family)
MFERAIAENPEDAAPYAAYADWLTEQGDPRGEFIRVQLALEDEALDSARRSAVRAEEDRLLKAHLREWLGPELAGVIIPGKKDAELQATVAFRRGWLDSLEFPSMETEITRALAASRATVRLRSLTFVDGGYEEEWDDLIGAPFVPRLRHFRIGSEPFSASGMAEPVTEFLRPARDLETLELMTHGVDTNTLFVMPFPRLRVLAVHCLSAYPLDVLTANPSFTNLERLAFHPHAAEPGDGEAYLRLAELQAITRSRFLKGIRHLEFHLSDAGDEGCRELVQSGFLKQLRHLSLAYGPGRLGVIED